MPHINPLKANRETPAQIPSQKQRHDSSGSIQSEAIRFVSSRKKQWERATAHITDKVSFNMRNLIRQLRKNYWGVFDDPVDKISGKEKIWPPLTLHLVENTVKNFDLDTKDINFRAKKAEAIGLTSLLRAAVKNELDEMFFGEKLDLMERQLAIDGTVVWKTTENKDGEKVKVELTMVDLLNFYIDPTAESIEQAVKSDVVMERHLMTPDEIRAKKDSDGWINTEKAQAVKNLHRSDPELTGTNTDTTSDTLVDVFEASGMISKFLITGVEADRKKLVKGHIVVSSPDHKGHGNVHLIEQLAKEDQIPYEEAWYTRVPNRWYGMGVGEKAMMLQWWLNTIVNIRINRSYVSQLGLFKVRANSGITPKMVSRLAATGAVTVNSMEDIEQMVMKEASEASYKDEENIMNWAERITSAFEIAVGENLPATTSATASTIQSQSAQSAFVMIKEGIGMFLQRWIKRHAMPIIAQNISVEDIVRITGNYEELREFDERIANELVFKKLVEMNEIGLAADPAAVESERQRVIEKMRGMGTERYVKLLKKIDVTQYDVQVYVSNEEIDKGVLAKNLLAALQVAPEYRESVMRMIFDVMGLDSHSLKAQPVVAPQEGAVRNLQSPNQSARTLVEASNTL